MSVLHVGTSNFDSIVKESSKTVLVDFWASWCGPCRMIAPILDEIAAERPDIKVCKVNVDEEQELAISYGVSSIPTVILFKDGKVSATSVGYRSKAQLLAALGL